MIRQTFPFFALLVFLILQGCTQYQTATPYQQKPDRRQVIEEPDMPGTTEQPYALTKNPIVKGISNQANQQMLNGELDAAAQTLERGLRIAPKEAFLWSQLAAIRLQQRHYEQAQSLAAKSSSLAKDNAALIRRNQDIIEEANR